MEWVYKYISWGLFIGGSVTGIGFLIKYLIQKKIDSYFNKKLETHKQELAIITEHAKYDISKKLYDFEAYASKRHSIYPELYSLAFESWSELTQFRYSFDANIMDFRKDLDIEALKSHFHKEFKETTDKLVNAYDYLYKNELYLSKVVTTAYNEALEAQVVCGRELGISFRSNLGDVERQRKDGIFSPLLNIDEKYLQISQEKIRILKEVIYNELSYTHSEEQKEEALS